MGVGSGRERFSDQVRCDEGSLLYWAWEEETGAAAGDGLQQGSSLEEAVCGSPFGTAGVVEGGGVRRALRPLVKEPGQELSGGGQEGGQGVEVSSPFFLRGGLWSVRGSLAWGSDGLCVTVRKGSWRVGGGQVSPRLSGSVWSRPSRRPAAGELNSTGACWSDKKRIEAVVIECLKPFGLWVSVSVSCRKFVCVFL